MTLSHNKLKKQQQEQNKRPKMISLRAISKREWRLSREKARWKKRNHVVVQA